MKKLVLIFVLTINAASAQVKLLSPSEQELQVVIEKDSASDASAGVHIECPDTVGLANPTCYGGINGYFRPDYGTFKTPIKRQLFILTDTGWVALISMLWDEIGPCAIGAGTYKWEVTDSLNIVHTYTATLTQPAAANVTITRTGNFNSCSGTITVNANGGVPPYKYKWSFNNVYSAAITTISSVGNLCEVPVHLIVYEGTNIFCGQIFNFHTGPVGFIENNTSSISIVPNPCYDYLKISGISDEAEITIMNAKSQVIYQNITSYDIEIDVSNFTAGVYFYKILRNGHIIRGKFTKQ